jgi:hypothetical protein
MIAEIKKGRYPIDFPLRTGQAILEGARQMANATISMNTRQSLRASFIFPAGHKL